MTMGERIRRVRKRRNMTLKALGMAVGLPESNADVRMAQYEAGTRSPKPELVVKLAEALAVSPHAISVPDISNGLALMHTLFAIEDLYEFEILHQDGETCLRPAGESELTEDLHAWCEMAEKLRNGEITRETYDDWRYNFPHLQED